MTGGDDGPTPDRESLVPGVPDDDGVSEGWPALGEDPGSVSSLSQDVRAEADEEAEAATEGLSDRFWRLFFWEGI